MGPSELLLALLGHGAMSDLSRLCAPMQTSANYPHLRVEPQLPDILDAPPDLRRQPLRDSGITRDFKLVGGTTSLAGAMQRIQG